MVTAPGWVFHFWSSALLEYMLRINPLSVFMCVYYGVSTCVCVYIRVCPRPRQAKPISLAEYMPFLESIKANVCVNLFQREIATDEIRERAKYRESSNIKVRMSVHCQAQHNAKWPSVEESLRILQPAGFEPVLPHWLWLNLTTKPWVCINLSKITVYEPSYLAT